MSEQPWRITLADVVIGEEERAAVDDVLRSGWLSMGPRTEEFERRFAEYVGGGHAVAVSSGTAALHLAAAALGLGYGDEVVVPALTFVASAAGMRQTGAGVRLADSLSLDDFSLDPREIDRLATEATRAVVVVHYGGYPADMAGVGRAARQCGLAVIEDAAHALGASLEGRACGTLGDAGCFSFFPNKNMTTGEGGMVVFADEAVAERARRLRSHEMTTLTWDRHRGHAATYDVVGVGFNYRIDEIRAALGIVQLRRLDDLNCRRGEITARYRTNFASSADVSFPTFGGRGSPAFHLAVVVTRSREARDGIREALRAERIQTSLHYPAIHRFSAYAHTGDALPVAEAIAERAVTLPLHPNLTDAEVDEISARVLDAVATA